MNKMKSYYLAHPCLEAFRIRKWELAFEKANPTIKLLNPFYDVDRPDIGEPNLNGFDQCAGNPTVIVEGDKALLQSADGVVAIITGSQSYGTIMEIMYAYDIQQMSSIYMENIILLITNGQEKHPWFLYHATQIVTTFTELEEAIRKL